MTVDRFVFEGFEADLAQGVFSFHYQVGDLGRFTERLTLPFLPDSWPSKKVLDRLLFQVHLALGVSYYKTFCPREIVIENGELTEDQAEFWRLFYERGLGEFFYKNQVDFRGLIRFEGKGKAMELIEWPTEDKALVLFSGGKDSIVSVEKLKKVGVPMDLLVVGNAEPVRRVTELTGERVLNVKRELDPRMEELNRLGMNGHVPLVGILSWIAVLSSAIYGYRWIVLSNESSASEGNVEYLGMQVNHQYSKSLEFEENLQKYLAKFLGPSVGYFSLLRGMNEAQIAQELGRHPEYFAEFSSCNRNFKLSERRTRLSWCGECPKCAFVFLTLAPFVERARLIEMFGSNLLDREELWPIYEELLGLARSKPFECVGTPRECGALMMELSAQDAWRGDALVQRFSILALNVDDLATILNETHSNAIPSDFLTKLS